MELSGNHLGRRAGETDRDDAPVGAHQLAGVVDDGLVADLKSMNTKFDQAPFSYKVGSISGTSGKVQGPEAIQIEVLERAPNYEPPN